MVLIHNVKKVRIEHLQIGEKKNQKTNFSLEVAEINVKFKQVNIERKQNNNYIFFL